MTRRTIRLLAILLFVFGHTYECFSQYGYNTNGLSIYYGATNRLDKTYRHSFSIDNWTLSGGCTASKYRGFGASFELTDNSNYNFGLRYFRSPQRHPSFSGLMFYLGAAPTVFSIANHWGLNAAPEIGLHIPFLYNTFGASVNLFYGYDIPIINENFYTNNRHRLTLKIGFDIDTKQFKELFKKKEINSKEKKDFEN